MKPKRKEPSSRSVNRALANPKTVMLAVRRMLQARASRRAMLRRKLIRMREDMHLQAEAQRRLDCAQKSAFRRMRLWNVQQINEILKRWPESWRDVREVAVVIGERAVRLRKTKSSGDSEWMRIKNLGERFHSKLETILWSLSIASNEALVRSAKVATGPIKVANESGLSVVVDPSFCVKVCEGMLAVQYARRRLLKAR